MNALCDQFHGCIRHPHQRIVGVCSSCLQERLISLIEPSPASQTETRGVYDVHQHFSAQSTGSHGVADRVEDVHPERTNPYAAQTNLSRHVANAFVDIALHSSEDLPSRGESATDIQTGSASAIVPSRHQDMQSLRSRSIRHGHPMSSDFVSSARGPSQNGHADKQDRSGCTEKRERRVASTNVVWDRRNRGSHSQNRAFNEGDKKRSGSWFFLSRSKSSSHVTSSQGDDTNLSFKSPQHNVASRGRSFDASRNVHAPDLEAIAEISSSRASTDAQNHVTRESSTSASWISVLFQRKKWSRSRCNSGNTACSRNGPSATSVANCNNVNSSEPTNRQTTVEAGRLSWDESRPNFKHMIRKVEARKKQQSQTEFASPPQFIDYNAKEHLNNGREITHQATLLQKSKSVASARSSISVEMPKDLMQSSFSPTIHQGQSNVTVGLEYDGFYDDGNLRRSRSWGRNWNRALSPLWGSRSHRLKAPPDAPSSAHQRDYGCARTPATPSYINLKNGATPVSSSSHLSPFRRNKLVPTLRKLL